jgi:hypothetical protein
MNEVTQDFFHNQIDRVSDSSVMCIFLTQSKCTPDELSRSVQCPFIVLVVESTEALGHGYYHLRNYDSILCYRYQYPVT